MSVTRKNTISLHLNTLESLFVLTMSIAIYCGNILVTLAVSLLWLMISLSRFKYGISRKFIGLLRVSLTPMISIHLYTLLLVLFGNININIVTTNLNVYIPIVLAFCTIIVFRNRALLLFFESLVLSYVYVFIRAFSIQGFYCVENALRQSLFLGEAKGANLLEAHEIVLSISYYWIIYLIWDKKNKKQTVLLSMLVCFILFLSMKRIAILAIVIISVVAFVIEEVSEKNKEKIIKLISIAAIVICFLYVSFIFNIDSFNSFLEKYGINSMARNHFFEYICSKAELSFEFTGLGRGAVFELMRQKYAGFEYVHSDLLKMYVEIGFIPFVIWLFYYFIYFRKYILKNYGKYAALTYFLCNLFTMMLYTTDNTEIYFACVFSRTIVPMFYCYESINKTTVISET